MVKYSKYLLLGLALFTSLSLEAQNGSFDVIKRDSEITRVTLENHMKRWNEEQLLNRIKTTEVQYKRGKGLTVKIDAPNSKVFLENGVSWSFNYDNELLDTFYDEEIIALQRERLTNCIAHFLADFNTYLPQIKDNETYTFILDIRDELKEEEEVQMTANRQKRNYQMNIQFEAIELDTFKELDEDEILQKLKIEIKPL